MLDLEVGARAVVARLNAADGNSPGAVGLVADLFGDWDKAQFNADPPRRAVILGSLVHAAYKAVPPGGDKERGRRGVYAPDARDRAAQGRNFLLSALFDTPGPVAFQTVLALAEEPEFAHFADRMRLHARRRAAEDSEFTAYAPEDIAALEARHELPPADRDALFRVMVDRLEDLGHDLAHGDFSDRRTLRTVSEEAEMQRTLAWRMRSSANGAYVVTREDEVADAKRTDIRIHAVRGGQRAVCEIKLADRRWTVGDLEQALRNQLVGQYLRHDDCRAGCLLLVWNGEKQHWLRPTDCRQMGFPDLVAHLNGKAREIEAEMAFHVRVAVIGLDLTNPYLAPAHGQHAARAKSAVDDMGSRRQRRRRPRI